MKTITSKIFGTCNQLEMQVDTEVLIIKVEAFVNEDGYARLPAVTITSKDTITGYLYGSGKKISILSNEANFTIILNNGNVVNVKVAIAHATKDMNNNITIVATLCDSEESGIIDLSSND